MVRYNASDRGAEREVFPVTDSLGVPVIAYTAQRWGALLQPTRDDPPGFVTPRAPDWYRFVLQSPSVSVTLAAPHNRAELNENLEVLGAAGPLSATEFDAWLLTVIGSDGIRGVFPESMERSVGGRARLGKARTGLKYFEAAEASLLEAHPLWVKTVARLTQTVTTVNKRSWIT